VANDLRQAAASLEISHQIQQTNSAPRKELAIVSPCSHCQNFIQQSSAGISNSFRSICPRRTWIQQSQNNLNDPLAVDPVLYLSGTTDPNILANPVVDESTNNYLVWVAAVDDNPGIVDANTNIITPGILDPDFNNLYIRCRLYPYVSEYHHDVLRSLGPFQENDQVIAEQHTVPSMTTPYTNGTIQHYNTPVAGTVAKTAFAYHFNVLNPKDHALVGGC
jgi:hypothetical protein